MRQYELVMVLSPNLEEPGLSAAIDKVSGWISDKGGAISSVEQWGMKKLAYPIKRFREGYYVLTRFEGEPRLSKELEGNLKFAEEVLRYLLVRLDA